LLGGVAGTLTGNAIEVDKGAEAVGFATDDSDHKRETESSGTNKGLGCASYTEPDRERVLQWTRVDALTRERGAVTARPVDVGGIAEGEEEVEFFREEIVVIFELEAKERKGFNEGTAANDDFGAAVGDEVECGEVLKDADGIRSAEDGDSRGKTDGCGAGSGRSENDGRGGVEVLAAVVFAEAEVVEANFVGEFDLFEEMGHAFLRGNGAACDGVWNQRCEAVDADLHLLALPSLC
jgi:hypothetical protein